MGLNWLIEVGTFEEDGNAQRMIDAIKDLKLGTVRAEKYVPFAGMEDNLFPPYSNVLFYGSMNACQFFQSKTNWIPFAWCDWKALRTSNYLTHYGEYSIHQRYGFYPFSELLRLRQFLFETYGEWRRVVIRPDDNDKRFHGEVVSDYNFERWYKTCKYMSRPQTV